MSKLTVIYALADPKTREVRYIGKTINPGIRINQHRCDKSKTYRGNWLRSINYAFEFIELDQAGENWAEIEQWWIAFFKMMGANLTNISRGGEGIPGVKRTAVTILKIKEALKGKNLGRSHTEEVKAIISACSKGNKYGLGYKHTDSAKSKMTEALVNRYSNPLERIKHSELVKERHRNPEYTERFSRIMTEKSNDPVYMKRSSDGQKKRWSDPVKRAEQSVKVRGQKRTPEQCEKVRQAVLASYQRRREQVSA